MNAIKRKESSSGANTYLMVPIFIFFVLLIFAVVRGPHLITSAGIGSAIIVAAPLILAAYALTIMVMAGRASIDLSIGPLIGFINVCMIQLIGIGFMESPIALFLFAMAVGAVYQLIMGLIIVFVRVQPIIVSLSGYLTLVGLNLIVMPKASGLVPEWMLSWGSGTSIFSPILVILIIATAGWYILAQTAFFGNLRMMGSDERATYTSGVNINLVRLGAHLIGGIYAGLAALTFTALISSGDPAQGTTYTLMAVTALVLGGANLAGGRGSAFGSLLGAFNIFLITYALSTFSFGMVQSYVTDLAYGGMLVISLLISVAMPQLQKLARNLSPLMFFMILFVITMGVIMHVAMDHLVEPLVSVPASSGYDFADQAVAAVDDISYSGGTYFLFIFIGLIAFVYAVRMLFKYTGSPMIGFIIVLIVAGLGLIFNPNTTIDTTPLVTTQAVGGSSMTTEVLGFFALETIGKAGGASFSSNIIDQSIYVLIAVVGIVLLASLIILVMLPQVESRTKRIAMILFGSVVAIISIGALFFRGVDKGYLDSNLTSEIYAIVLVGVLLFTITAPLVHTKVRNINNLFIGALSILAVITVYFFSSSSSIPTDAVVQVAGYAEPVIRTGLEPAPWTYIKYADPIRVNIGASGISVFAELAYYGLIIVLLHIFLRIAMAETSFRSFWRYWYIVVFTALAWVGLFYSVGVPIWKMIAVIAIAIITAPIIMHIISTYLVGEDRDRAVSAMISKSGE